MPDIVDRQAYNAVVGDVFRIALTDAPTLDVTLVEVSAGGPQSTSDAQKAGRPSPFSLLFRGPTNRPLQQATYQLAHDKLGAQDVFLVPIGPHQDGLGYEAVFN